MPRRRPAGASLHGVHAVGFDGEADRFDLRRDLFRRDERAPVERLDRRTLREPCGFDGVDDELREGLRIDRLVGISRRDLGLDVEPKRLPVRLHELEDLRERGKALAVARLLLGELFRVGAFRIDSSDVVLLQFGERQRVDRRAFRREPSAVGTADEIRIEERIVRDDEHAVAGHREIGLDRRHADRRRARVRGHRVLGRETARAAMALHVEREGRRSSQHEERHRRRDRESHCQGRAAPRHRRPIHAVSHARTRGCSSTSRLTTNSGRRPASASTMLARPVAAML